MDSPRVGELVTIGTGASQLDAIVFDTPSGGGVFSVGSITWPASLPVDENVSKITANVLRRFT